MCWQEWKTQPAGSEIYIQFSRSSSSSFFRVTVRSYSTAAYILSTSPIRRKLKLSFFRFPFYHLLGSRLFFLNFFFDFVWSWPLFFSIALFIFAFQLISFFSTQNERKYFPKKRERKRIVPSPFSERTSVFLLLVCEELYCK